MKCFKAFEPAGTSGHQLLLAACVGRQHQQRRPHVSVRALILALGRFEIASKDKARVLEKEWAAYRKHR